jgi:N-acyl-D-amino-acid deacylase
VSGSLLLRGGLVLDGMGTPAAEADVAVQDGRITVVPRGLAATAETVIDVEGAVVAPGFIDTHVHSDLAAYLPEDASVRLASLRQGVTTEVCGNCGFSVFPALPAARTQAAELARGLFGEMAEVFASYDDYRTALSARALPVNLAPLVGHGMLRTSVVGPERRPPTTAELRAMRGLLDDALSAGAFGLSTGLIYAPGMYAEAGELVELGRSLAAAGRPYTSHIRSEFAAVEEAVEEALDVGRHSGCAVHISHHKVAGRANYGRIGATLGRIEKARDGGLDVTADVYPYTAGSTVLHALLPPWVTEGGVPAMLGRLREDAVRRQISADIDRGLPGWPNNVGGPEGWADVAIAYAPANPEVEGMRVDALAAASGRSPVDVVADLLLASDGAVTIVIHQMDEPDVREVLRRPWTTIGSDAIPLPGKPHPRAAGTFPRVLGHYAREGSAFSLAEAVRKMTSAAADRFGLDGRGRLVDGAVADLVVFDPAVVLDQATYADPLLPPVGIRHVIVGGRLAVRDGSVVDAAAGQVLSA